MAEGMGETGDAVAAARARVARGDAALADADRRLAEAVSGAYRVVAESVRRLEAVRAEIDGAVAGRIADSTTGAADLARFLLVKHREVADIVAAAAAEAHAKTLVLKELSAAYVAHTRP